MLYEFGISQNLIMKHICCCCRSWFRTVSFHSILYGYNNLQNASV